MEKSELNGEKFARRAARAWRLRHIGSSCKSLELLTLHYARLRPSAVASLAAPAAPCTAPKCNPNDSYTAGTCLLTRCTRASSSQSRASAPPSGLRPQQRWQRGLRPQHRWQRGLRGTCGARNAILMILMRQQEPDSCCDSLELLDHNHARLLAASGAAAEGRSMAPAVPEMQS